MVISYKAGNLLVDEIELQAQLLSNEITDIIEEVYAREINRLVYDKQRKHCKGCKLDEDEVWICYYEATKEQFNVKFPWRAAEKYILERLDLQLCER